MTPSQFFFSLFSSTQIHLSLISGSFLTQKKKRRRVKGKEGWNGGTASQMRILDGEFSSWSCCALHFVSFLVCAGVAFFLEADAGMCREKFQNGHISTARDRGKGYLREGVKQHKRKWRSSVQEMLNTLVPTWDGPTWLIFPTLKAESSNFGEK